MRFSAGQQILFVRSDDEPLDFINHDPLIASPDVRVPMQEELEKKLLQQELGDQLHAPDSLEQVDDVIHKDQGARQNLKVLRAEQQFQRLEKEVKSKGFWKLIFTIRKFGEPALCLFQRRW